MAWCVFFVPAFLERTEVPTEGTMGVVVETVKVAVGGAIEAVMEGTAGALPAVAFCRRLRGAMFVWRGNGRGTV